MKNTLIWVVAIIVLVGGGYWWMQSQEPAVSDSESTVMKDGNDAVQAPMPVIGSDTTEMIVTPAMSAVVTYDGNSFSPSEVTIKKGGKVTFASTDGSMWVASGPHPQHTNYDGTSREAHCAARATPSFDQCAVGTSYTFTFDKVGTWPYHNHVSAGMFGKVVVVE